MKKKIFDIVGIVSLVKGRIRNSYIPIEAVVRDVNNILEKEPLLGLPFKWIGLIVRCGIKNKLKPEYNRIDKKDGELPIAVELDMDVLKWADEHDLKLLNDIFMIAALEALLDVGKKYNLPTAYIAAKRAEYGDIPESVEELEGLRRIRLKQPSPRVAE